MNPGGPETPVGAPPDIPTAAVEVTGVAAGGAGIGRLADGRVVFVEGALPGETAEAAVVTAKRDYVRARATRLLTVSPDRAEPVCPNVAAGCGGCGWAHVSAGAQAELGRRVVVDALRRLGRIPDPPVRIGPQLGADGYRTTVTLGADPGGRLGYHRAHGRDLVLVDDCRVAHPALADLIGGVRAPGWHAVTLRFGVGGGERLVVLHPPPSASRRRLRSGAPARARSSAVVAPRGAVVVGPGEDAVLHHEVGGRWWQVSARSFFQAGPAGAGLVADVVDAAVGDALGAGGRLVDAYAGVGLLGGILAARHSARLTAVESQPSAVADARVNLDDLGAEVIPSELGRWTPEPADVVVADPARPGLGRPGVRAVTGTGAKRIVVVSCDPASGARDTALLAGAGYRLVSADVVGLFPDTVHVETVSRFDWRG